MAQGSASQDIFALRDAETKFDNLHASQRQAVDMADGVRGNLATNFQGDNGATLGGKLQQWQDGMTNIVNQLGTLTGQVRLAISEFEKNEARGAESTQSFNPLGAAGERP